MAYTGSASQNAIFAADALQHARSVLPYGPANLPSIWLQQTRRATLLTFISRAFQLWQVRTDEETRLAGVFGVARARAVARAAANIQTGNCAEFSAVAFVYLLDRSVRPIEWIRCAYKDHAFVLIGRDRTSNIDNWLAWGNAAAICDAWNNEAYPLDEISDFRNREAYSAGYFVDATSA